MFTFSLQAKAQIKGDKNVLLIPLNLEEHLVSSNLASITITEQLFDSSFLGVAPSSENNIRTNIVAPNNNIRRWLQEYVSTQFAGAFNPGGANIKWKISALNVGTDSSSSGVVSFTRLNADVYRSFIGSDDELITNFDTLIISDNPLPDFGQNIQDAIKALYVHSNNSVSNKSSGIAENNLTGSLFKPNKEKSKHSKIFMDKVFNQGILLSYQEFLDDAPSSSNFFVGVDNQTSKVKIFQLTSDSSMHLIVNPWGLSIHNELYKFVDGGLYAIEQLGNGFILSKYKDYKTRKNNANFWRANVGSRMGNANPYDDKHIIRVPALISNDLKIEATHLDMNTGKLSF